MNASEAINGAGGSILGKDGAPDVDTTAAKAGLQNLVDAFKDGNIPAEAITYQEEQGRTAFENGKLLFLRNWPYVYNLAKTDGSSKVKGHVRDRPAARQGRRRRLDARRPQTPRSACTRSTRRRRTTSSSS